MRSFEPSIAMRKTDILMKSIQLKWYYIKNQKHECWSEIRKWCIKLKIDKQDLLSWKNSFEVNRCGGKSNSDKIWGFRTVMSIIKYSMRQLNMYSIYMFHSIVKITKYCRINNIIVLYESFKTFTLMIVDQWVISADFILAKCYSFP